MIMFLLALDACSQKHVSKLHGDSQSASPTGRERPVCTENADETHAIKKSVKPNDDISKPAFLLEIREINPNHKHPLPEHNKRLFKKDEVIEELSGRLEIVPSP